MSVDRRAIGAGTVLLVMLLLGVVLVAGRAGAESSDMNPNQVTGQIADLPDAVSGVDVHPAGPLTDEEVVARIMGPNEDDLLKVDDAPPLAPEPEAPALDAGEPVDVPPFGP